MVNVQNRKEKQQLLLKHIQEMSYFDDEFMTKCLEDYPKGVELMLRIIMDNDELVVKEAQVQAVVKNLQGRSIRMDVKTNDVLANSIMLNCKKQIVEQSQNVQDITAA